MRSLYLRKIRYLRNQNLTAKTRGRIVFCDDLTREIHSLRRNRQNFRGRIERCVSDFHRDGADIINAFTRCPKAFADELSAAYGGFTRKSNRI